MLLDALQLAACGDIRLRPSERSFFRGTRYCSIPTDTVPAPVAETHHEFVEKDSTTVEKDRVAKPVW